MTLLEAIILSIIEGITEFLPVSSTGHMIIAAELMGMEQDAFLKTFEVAIQSGAILAVITIYFKRFFAGLELYFKLFVAFIPIAVVGFLFYDLIKDLLFNVYVVSATLAIGGIFLILLDRWAKKIEYPYEDFMDISYLGALKVGLFQCLSVIPGVSRAAASIFGGVIASRLTPKQSAEFSFLLGVPTIFAATGYDLIKSGVSFTQEQWILFIIGLFIAFFTAWLTVKAFLSFLENYGYKHFGYYRIALAVIFLIFVMATGLDLDKYE